MSERKLFALYVHWPWCKSKCPYCDFNSHASHIQERDYVDAVCRDILAWKSPQSLAGRHIEGRSPETHQLTSLFFGGGTPSLMDPSSITRIIAACSELGLITEATEITVECNPTSFSQDRSSATYFEELRLSGVNRLSIGIQGLKPEWLRFLGRDHAVKEALATLDSAQRTFRNVNADVIYGLPNQTPDAWLKQLELLTARKLTHISAYQLTIEPNTRFFSDVRRGKWQPIPSDLEADFFDATQGFLTSAGYNNYEISNFALPGYECQHNSHVWKYGEYLGVGAGAHGRVIDSSGGIVATQVLRHPESYLRQSTTLEGSFSHLNPLSSPESSQEALFSGLRLKIGFDESLTLKRFGGQSYAAGVSHCETQRMLQSGHLERNETHLKLTPQGWPLLNSVLNRLLSFIPDEHATEEDASITNNPVHQNNISVTIL